ncbi:hypothetical protein HN011_011761 [Eciton burchellii]|nr:hypothetical protein HN011_011761 [Eciton burchellii]
MPGGRRNISSRTGPTSRSGSTYTSPANINGRSNSGERTVGSGTDDRKLEDICGGKSLAPKHVPIPVVPVDGQLTFETLSLVFAVVATFLQLLNLYRTVWWLPHSYNAYSMNLYLIDPYLLIFILTMVTRSFIYTLLHHLIDASLPVRWLSVIQKILRISLLIALMSVLCWCLYHMAERHSFIKMLCLCYLLSIYLVMSGIGAAFFDTSFSCGKEERKAKYLLEKPLHNCSLNASAIRAEVSTLRSDFNQRLKWALCSSSGSAFACGIAPIIFVPPYLHFNRLWVMQYAILLLLGRINAYVVQAYPVRYCDVLHRAALHLGRWIKTENRSNHVYAQPWNDTILWPHGSIVRHNRGIYRSEGLCTAAEPGNLYHYRFHLLFNNPAMLVCSLLALQLVMVGVQLFILLRTNEWYQIVSMTLLLIMNYYTLFKLTRDYLICSKVYRAEQIIQEKSQMVVNPVAQ